jgi:small subunit ribosomal protein S21
LFCGFYVALILAQDVVSQDKGSMFRMEHHPRFPVSCFFAHRGSSGGVGSLAEVRIQEGEPLENALRRFKRKVQQEDIIKEVKRHSFYLKPGEKRRVKEALARKRNRKKARKEQD